MCPRSRRPAGIRRRRGGRSIMTPSKLIRDASSSEGGTRAAPHRADRRPSRIQRPRKRVAAAPAIATGGAGEIVLPQVIVDAGPSAVGRFLESFGVAYRERGRRTVGRWGNSSGGARPEGSGCATSPRSTWPPTSGRTPGSVPTVKQHLAAIRMLGDWLVVNQVLPVNPAAVVRGPKHGRHQGRDAGALAGGGEEAPRVDRHGRPGRAPGPGAALGDALQLRAGERGVGDAAAGLLRSAEPELVEAPREGREAARRAGPPPGGRGPRRLRRGGQA